MAVDWGEFLVQSLAGLVGALLGFLAAFISYRIQRKDDEKDVESDVRARRRALLTYLAAESRRNYHMSQSLAKLFRDGPSLAQSAKDPGFEPYKPANMSDQAYHACLTSPDTRLADDKELLSALVDTYSAIPLWRSIEHSLWLETHSGSPARAAAALQRASHHVNLAEGQAARFLHIYRLLMARGVAAEAVPFELPEEPPAHGAAIA